FSASRVDSHRRPSPLRGAPRRLLARLALRTYALLATPTCRPPRRLAFARIPLLRWGHCSPLARLGLRNGFREWSARVVGLVRRLASPSIPALRGPSPAARAPRPPKRFREWSG